jgi:outer membrane protein assembly factor BamB
MLMFQLSNFWLLKRRGFFVIFYSLLLFGCSGQPEKVELPAPLVEFTPTVTIETAWTVNAGGRSDRNHLKLTPAISQGMLFTPTPSGLIRAFHLSDGQTVWERQLDIAVAGGLSAEEGLVLLGGSNGEVIALAQADGQQRWQTQVSSQILAPPHAAGGVVVVRTLDGKLFGLDGASGSRLWVYERSVPILTLHGTGSPVIVGEMVVAGFDNGKLVGVELRSGKLLWEVNVATPRGRTELERMVDLDADPKIVDNIVYATSFQGRTIAMELKNGRLLWERDVSSYNGLAVDSQALYVSDANSDLWAFDRFSGASLWKQTALHLRKITAPAIIGDNLVVGDNDGYLHWMRRSDGQLVARYHTGENSLLVPPLVVGDLLLAYNTSGKVFALQQK